MVRWPATGLAPQPGCGKTASRARPGREARAAPRRGRRRRPSRAAPRPPRRSARRRATPRPLRRDAACHQARIVAAAVAPVLLEPRRLGRLIPNSFQASASPGVDALLRPGDRLVVDPLAVEVAVEAAAGGRCRAASGGTGGAGPADSRAATSAARRSGASRTGRAFTCSRNARSASCPPPSAPLPRRASTSNSCQAAASAKPMPACCQPATSTAFTPATRQARASRRVVTPAARHRDRLVARSARTSASASARSKPPSHQPLGLVARNALARPCERLEVLPAHRLRAPCLAHEHGVGPVGSRPCSPSARRRPHVRGGGAGGHGVKPSVSTRISCGCRSQ